jgi:hypothetical protein
VKLPAPKLGSQSSKVRAQAARDLRKGRHPRRKVSRTRSSAKVPARLRAAHSPVKPAPAPAAATRPPASALLCEACAQKASEACTNPQ